MDPKKSPLLRIALAAFALATIAGCGNKDGGTSVGIGRDGRAGGSVLQQNGQYSLPGRVTDGNQSSFYYAAQGLVSAQIPENALCGVSAQGQGGTGVFFGGQVRLSGNPSSGNASVQQGSLIVGVYDSCVGQMDPQTGRAADPIGIGLNHVQGNVNGNNVQLEFSDDAGSIMLNGYVSGGVFTGVFSYVNRYHVDGGDGAVGTLGTFQVPACQFFQPCN